MKGETNRSTSIYSDGDFSDLLEQFISGEVDKIWTAELVIVMSVSEDKKRVDILPLYSRAGNDADQNDALIKPTVISGVRSFTYKGGGCAVIVEPHVGDIGLAFVCKQDITNFTGNETSDAPKLPLTVRRFNRCDAIYFGGLDNTPIQYFVKIQDGKITVKAPVVDIQAETIIKLQSPLIALGGQLATLPDSEYPDVGVAKLRSVETTNGVVNTGGGITNTGGGNISDNGITLRGHIHGGVQNGGGTTTPPTGG